MSTTDVRIHFADALESVASTERLFLLTSFANMATTRKEVDRDFIETVCLELVEIGFQTPALFESCCKGARDMLANVAQVHPWILSFLVKQMNQAPDLMSLGKVRKRDQLLAISCVIYIFCFVLYISALEKIAWSKRSSFLFKSSTLQYLAVMVFQSYAFSLKFLSEVISAVENFISVESWGQY